MDNDGSQAAMDKALANISPARHIFGWACGTPMAVFTVALFFTVIVGFSRQERFALALIAMVLAIPVGLVIGVCSYYVARGAVHWGGVFARLRAHRDEVREEEEIDAAADALIEQVEEQTALERSLARPDSEDYPMARPQDD